MRQRRQLRFSFLMVALKMEIGRSCKGVSLKMMERLASRSCSSAWRFHALSLIWDHLLLAMEQEKTRVQVFAISHLLGCMSSGPTL